MERWFNMGKIENRRGVRIMSAVMCLTLAGISHGAGDEARLAELERKVEILSAELEQRQYRDMMPPIGEGMHGMGPAASKVYAVNEDAVSLGGYGEALYQNFEGAKSDQSDFLRAVLYFGYKFDDQWVLNTEIEFEHASTDKEGSTSVEFAYLDYLYSEAVNLRVGLLLVPVGLVNELHEPTVFLSARRPDTENVIIPTTWRENGIGLFGDVGNVTYKAYLVNSLRGEDFGAKGLRGGRQKGSKSVADDFAGVLRTDWEAMPGMRLGGSIYYGNSGQNIDVSVMTEIYEAHLDWRHRGWTVRALYAAASLDDVAELNRIIAGPDVADDEIDSVGTEMRGWYVEAGYDVLNARDSGEHALTPFVRYEQFDTQDEVPAGFASSGKTDVDVVTVGLNYKPRDQIVFKADYQFYDNQADSGTDQGNLALGYEF
jgi:hypothetical protein